jgi:hypothetical protein
MNPLLCWLFEVGCVWLSNPVYGKQAHLRRANDGSGRRILISQQNQNHLITIKAYGANTVHSIRILSNS